MLYIREYKFTSIIIIMKQLINLFSFLFILTIFISACSKDDDDKGRCDDGWNPGIELQEELQALVDASTEYGNDPDNKEKCEAYKQAYLNYLSAVREWEDCYRHIGQHQEFLDAVEEAERDVMAIDCN